MIKILQLGTHIESTGEARVTVLDSALVKTASNDIQNFWNNLPRDEGKVYLHVLAMTATGWYSCNNNGDGFKEEDLKKDHQGFVSDANIFLHHVNKDPKKSIGKPIFAFYNDQMHRVELVLAADKSKAPGDIVAKIKAGDPIAVSMGVRVKHDVCSICSNEAKTRGDYCAHLRYNMKTILPDGRQVFAWNPGPLKFFDISIVTKPADRTAWALQKAASDEARTQEKTSAELGEEYEDTQEKLAALRKLSEILKEIDATPVKAKDGTCFPQLSFDEMDNSNLSPGALLHTIVGSGAFPTLGEAAFIAGRHFMGDAFNQGHVPQLIGSLPSSVSMLEKKPELINSLISEILSSVQANDKGLKITLNIEPVIAERKALLDTLTTREEKAEHVKTASGILSALQIYNSAPQKESRKTPVRQFVDDFTRDLTTGGTPVSQTYTVRGSDGKRYRTTEGSIRVANNADAVAGTVRTGVSAGLALAAIAAAMSKDSTATKLLATPIFAALSAGIFPGKQQLVESEEGKEVPINALFSQVKEGAAKDEAAKKAVSLMAPALGATVPAVLGLDYLYNKHVRGRRDPMYQRRMGFMGRTLDKAGKFTMEHPGTMVAAGAIAGAGGKHWFKNFLQQSREKAVKMAR
jgi:hypothetical protein